MNHGDSQRWTGTPLRRGHATFERVLMRRHRDTWKRARKKRGAQWRDSNLKGTASNPSSREHCLLDEPFTTATFSSTLSPPTFPRPLREPLTEGGERETGVEAEEVFDWLQNSYCLSSTLSLRLCRRTKGATEEGEKKSRPLRLGEMFVPPEREFAFLIFQLPTAAISVLTFFTMGHQGGNRGSRLAFEIVGRLESRGGRLKL